MFAGAGSGAAQRLATALQRDGAVRDRHRAPCRHPTVAHRLRRPDCLAHRDRAPAHDVLTRRSVAGTPSVNRWLASRRTGTLNSLTGSPRSRSRRFPSSRSQSVVVGVLVWRRRIEQALVIVFGLVLEITRLPVGHLHRGPAASDGAAAQLDAHDVELPVRPHRRGRGPVRRHRARSCGRAPATRGCAFLAGLVAVARGRRCRVLAGVPRHAPPDRRDRRRVLRCRVPVVRRQRHERRSPSPPLRPTPATEPAPPKEPAAASGPTRSEVVA